MSGRVLFFVFLGVSLGLQAAEVLEVKPVADTTLFQVAPGNNMGGHAHVAIGTTSVGGAARGMFRFDLSAIPTNATVEMVTLTFDLPPLPRVDAGGSPYAIHRVLKAWGEGGKSGNQGAPAATGEATWNHSAFPRAWQQAGAGGDYVAEASGTEVLGPAPGIYMVGSTTGLVSDVQFWVANQVENFGWLVKVVDESVTLTARRFASRETTNAPILRVEYSVPSRGDLEITSVSVVDGNLVIRWNDGQGGVAIEKSPELNGAWQEAGGSEAGEFIERASADAQFYRLRK